MLLIVLAGTSTGCGIRGPLTLPEQGKTAPPKADHKRPSSGESATAATQATSATSANY
jgi:predicted small lipoprotein YifL